MKKRSAPRKPTRAFLNVETYFWFYGKCNPSPKQGGKQQ